MEFFLSCLVLASACSAYSPDVSLSYGASRDGKFDRVSMATLSAALPVLDLRRGWRIAYLGDAGAIFTRQSDEGESDRGAVVMAGPALIHERRFNNTRWTIELSTRPAWLSQREFHGRDLGSSFHFASHAGVFAEAMQVPLRVGFRYMHISNGGIGPTNPGIDFAIVSLGVTFGLQQ